MRLNFDRIRCFQCFVWKRCTIQNPFANDLRIFVRMNKDIVQNTICLDGFDQLARTDVVRTDFLSILCISTERSSL